MDNTAPDAHIRTPLKVIGVGGAGINAVNAMVAAQLRDVDFLAVSTRESDLAICRADKKLVLPVPPGDTADQGLSAYVQGTELLLMVVGMGGTTGSTLAPVIAQQARDAGALVMAIVTKPFASEGKRRGETAEKGIERLRECCDCLVVIPNDCLHELQDGGDSLLDTFKAADDVVKEAILALSEQGRAQGDCCVELPRIREIFTIPGPAAIATGIAGGESRATIAARQALSCPLLDGYTISGAAGLIISVTGASNITLQEYEEIVRTITSVADQNAAIISGMAIDESLETRARVTIIATGLKEALPLPKPEPKDCRTPGFFTKMVTQLRFLQKS